MAEHYVKAIRASQPNGPYLLGGWSMGGTVAYEMAQQMRRQGQEVALLAMLDNGKMSSRKLSNRSDTELLIDICSFFDVSLSLDRLSQLSIDEQLIYAKRRMEEVGLIPKDMGIEYLRQHFSIYKAHLQATESYYPRPYAGRVSIFRTERETEDGDNVDLEWETLALEGFQIYKIPGTHYTMMRAPHVQSLANQLTICLNDAHSRIEASTQSV
jgi:thioesterase domain-containing protein